MDKAAVHTLVPHRNPDLEVLFMAWLIEQHPGTRRKLGLEDEVSYKYISAGQLRPEEWPGETELDAAELEAKGYLFLDCGGGRFDQHGAPANIGVLQDLLASVDFLMEGTGILKTDPAYLPLARLISVSDRTGQSVCAKMPYDKNGETPHVARDIRTMVTTLNERYPDDPELVRRVFFLAMDGLEFLFGQMVTEEFERTGQEVDEGRFDLREMNFMSVDNAVRGIRESALARGASEEDAEREVERVMAPVREAWWLREQDWKTAARDLKQAVFRAITPFKAVGFSGLGKWKVVAGESAARSFPQAARRKGADVVAQFYPDGRFLITRKGEDIPFDHLTAHLRAADARKRGGRVISPENLLDRGTSVVCVEVSGEEKCIPQFYFPGFAVGNRFATNPDGLAVSPLTKDEIVRLIQLALGGVPLEPSLLKLFGDET